MGLIMKGGWQLALGGRCFFDLIPLDKLLINP